VRTLPQVAEIESVAYHRNGVNGEGFFAGIFGASVDGEPPHAFLGVIFPSEEDENKAGGNPRIAIFDLELLKQHDIGFGSNSWRGDMFVEVMESVIAAQHERWDARDRARG
jgi:hypothetical protein